MLKGLMVSLNVDAFIHSGLLTGCLILNEHGVALWIPTFLREEQRPFDRDRVAEDSKSYSSVNVVRWLVLEILR